MRLGQSRPNPADGELSIGFTLPRAGVARLRVLDVAGRLVATLVNGSLPAGPHTARWDGTTVAGAAAAPGVYLYELRSGGERITRRLVLTR